MFAARHSFGVAPGNHDYDAMWSADAFPLNLSKPREELTLTPEMSDEGFHAADDFTLELIDFGRRFGPPRR
jgi:hypothetical protein